VAGLIDTLTRLSSPWAYVVVGLLATAEAVFVGLVLPGELALLLGGFLASQGRVSLAGMVAVAAVAAVAGYLLGYATGRRLGPALRTGALGRRSGRPAGTASRRCWPPGAARRSSSAASSGCCGR
jgi:membrane protein DedA with SNARE-associated domain